MKKFLCYDTEQAARGEINVDSRGMLKPVDSELSDTSTNPVQNKVIKSALDTLSEEIVTTAESKVSAHNTGTDTHSDIRLLISGLTDRLNALSDSDDTTLDQLSEIVAYIKNNRTLIEAITTDKVSVADIVDNLTTNVSNKPLSAAQGVVLKEIIDALTIPTALSDLTEDSSHRVVTDVEKAAWNAKSNFSGSYNDLTDKPTIPNVPVQSVNGKTGAVVLSAVDVGALPDSTVIPAALPNPNALTFTGAVTGSYDGSEPLTVNIPSSGGGSGSSGGLSNWCLIKTLVFSSEIAEIIFSEDDNGRAFAVKEIMIVGTVPAFTSGGYIYCGINTGGLNAVWPTAGKEMRWWLASVDGVLKTMLAVSNTAVALPVDKNFGCPSDIVAIRVGASTGFTADGTLYVYGR